MIVIDKQLCNGCRMCIEACPEEALGLVQKKAVVNDGACAQCGTCIDVCPENAIEMQNKAVLDAQDEMFDDGCH